MGRCGSSCVSGKGFLSLTELYMHNKWSPVFLQVHKLEPETWKHVEAIYIDIADRSQVLSKVGSIRDLGVQK